MKIPGINEDKLREFLETCRELNHFCSQNGWIDNDTLDFEVRRREGNFVWVTVHFTEVVMEGSGCVADRVDCFGMLKLALNASGDVEGATIL